jgi:hypothetical protein
MPGPGQRLWKQYVTSRVWRPRRLPRRRPAVNRSHHFSRTAAVAACVLSLTLSLGTTPAEARERPARSYSPSAHVQKGGIGRMRQDTWTNPRGKSTSRSTPTVRPDEPGESNRPVIERTENGYTREQTVTNGKGETSTRTTVVERDPETGTYSKTKTFTGFDGRTHSKTSEVQKTDTSYSRTREITHKNGSVTSQQVTGTYDPVTKTWSRDVDTSHTKPPAPQDSADAASGVTPPVVNPVP